ncbi:F-box protein SKIP23-like [Lathyrus oleraceus]|uniref:F-box protein SKIP23-like n=1 Tax=Pisum sativum TaxID=3888 RepID=UPI0021CFD7EA|nr:F-box protein SKIP23-like [Pisum sativum]
MKVQQLFSEKLKGLSLVDICFESSLSMEVDWGNLESLPLNLIFDKLAEPVDRIYFSVVCKNWYAIAKFNYENGQIQNNVLPMLMIPTKNKCRTERSLYGISSKTDYNIKLPVPHNKRFCGSSHGWLAKVDNSSEHTLITLLNPFKDALSITLPPIYIMDILRRKRYYECNVHKVVLSADPTIRPHDYVVVAIYGMSKYIAFLKAGQQIWTYIDQKYFCFNDAIFYKDLVYVVGRWNDIYSFDVCNLKKKEVIPKVLSREDDDYAHGVYLVKSLEGDLWLVKKIIAEKDEFFTHGAERFEVFHLELDLQSGKVIRMVKLNSLGDNVLFVGDSDSISMSASYFSNYLQKDSIYYTDDFYDDTPNPYPNGPFDMKVYNIKEEKFSQHCPFQPWFRQKPPALWVIPPFQLN